jgi:hypothetical protein
MFRDEGHPDVSLSDWEAFCKWHTPASASGAPQCRAIEKVVDRSEIRLPARFLPIARGAAIASSYLLRRAGYSPGAHRPRGWKKPKRRAGSEEVFKELSREYLIILRCGLFWQITRDYGTVRPPHRNFALAHIFGSTPILTRTYQEATYLAEFCSKDGPLPSGLCWVRGCPDDMNGAIHFALDRRIAETRACHQSSLQVPQCPIP